MDTTRQMIQHNEEFYSPFSGQVLIKAEEQGGKWIVYLQASNERLDQDREVIFQKALTDAKDYYLTHGVLSWDHKHKALHDPGFIIGEPMDVAFSKSHETLVKGWLYQHNPIAQGLWKNIESGAQKLGASIGGGIIRKSKGDGKEVSSYIEKIVWDETALTHKPVNDGTLGSVRLIPFPEFAKALMAGAGVDAASYSGGRALTGENLDEVVKDATFGQSDVTGLVTYEEGRRYFDGVIGQIMKGKIRSMNDVIAWTLDQGYESGVAASLIDFISRKIPNLR